MDKMNCGGRADTNGHHHNTNNNETSTKKPRTEDGTETKKHSRHHRHRRAAAKGVNTTAPSVTENNPNNDDFIIEIEYVVPPPEQVDDPSLAAAFARFSHIEPTPDVTTIDTSLAPIAPTTTSTITAPSTTTQTPTPPTTLKRNKKHRPTIATLKQSCPRPSVVDPVDITSPDPELLVYLKSRPNAVPVPRHWATWSRYLASRRGSNRPIFQLPEHIRLTGIAKLRESADDTTDALRKRMRQRVRPKLGMIDIDYQVLHDAFFKHQKAPEFSRFGEVFYEGKESEADKTDVVPGVYSDRLRRALGMPTYESEGAAVASIAAPPWLANMQRLGPPPSYATLRFPGVNAPLPPGASWGQMGWGKPPIDPFGLPLFGNVMDGGGAAQQQESQLVLWGTMSSSSSNKMAQDDGEVDDYVDDDGEIQEEDEAPTVVEIAPPQSRTKMMAPPPLPPSAPPAPPIDLRKKPAHVTEQAFRILETATISATPSALFPSTHQYVVGSSASLPVTEPVPPPPDANKKPSKDAKKFKF